MLSSAIRYRIVHRTQYEYSEPVLICQNQLKMFPRTRSRITGSVTCHTLETKVDPIPDFVQQHIDYFGNTVYSFSVESPHDQLFVEVSSEVTVATSEIAVLPSNSPWEQQVAALHDKSNLSWQDVGEYRFDSPRIRQDKSFAEYALKSFTNGRDLIEAGLELTNRINQDFAYDQTATDVSTTPERAFRIRAGVCQDFAHVQIACLRSIGLPAQYVSGYLRTTAPPGQPRLVGADESHAWVRLYTGPALGWVDLDPTNGCVAGTSHVATCAGRDYSDVSPMRGVITGSGQTTLNVSVDMSEV